MKRTIIAVILSVFLFAGCGGITKTQVLHNTLIGAQLTTDVVSMLETYPKVVKIIKAHPEYFNEEDLAKLSKGKEMLDFAIIELMKLRNIRSLSTIPDLNRMYKDLMFIWASVAKVYENDASIVMGAYDRFTVQEMLTINTLDGTMRDINFNLDLLFGDKSEFNESKAKEILPILMQVIKVVATMSVVIGV